MSPDPSHDTGRCRLGHTATARAPGLPVTVGGRTATRTVLGSESGSPGPGRPRDGPTWRVPPRLAARPGPPESESESRRRRSLSHGTAGPCQPARVVPSVIMHPGPTVTGVPRWSESRCQLRLTWRNLRQARARGPGPGQPAAALTCHGDSERRRGSTGLGGNLAALWSLPGWSPGRAATKDSEQHCDLKSRVRVTGTLLFLQEHEGRTDAKM